MDLNNRSFRPGQTGSVQHSEQNIGLSQGHSDPGAPKKRGKFGRVKPGGALNITYVFLLFSVTVVLVGALMALVLFKNTSQEERFVDQGKYQAIFLNNGQVYFGKIGDLNKDFLTMSDIYYLRVNQQVQPDQKAAAAQNDVSLVKLGCELHGPQDSMVINREQITFWENLKDDGQVAKAVAEYKKANPNGQNCEQQAQNQKPAANNASSEDADSTEPANTNNDTSGDTSNNGATNNDTPTGNTSDNQ
jgi:hypothetical protein